MNQISGIGNGAVPDDGGPRNARAHPADDTVEVVRADGGPIRADAARHVFVVAWGTEVRMSAGPGLSVGDARLASGDVAVAAAGSRAAWRVVRDDAAMGGRVVRDDAATGGGFGGGTGDRTAGAMPGGDAAVLVLRVGADRLRGFARDVMGLSLDDAALSAATILRSPVFGCGAMMLDRMSGGDGPGARVRREAAERVFLSGVVEAFSAGPLTVGGDLSPDAWTAILDHVALNLDRKLLVDDLVDLTPLSPTRFNEAFRARTGLSPHAWIVAERLARARDLLVGTTDTLAAIAARCGFADHAHLTRAFRKAEGVSPSAWRRAARGG